MFDKDILLHWVITWTLLIAIICTVGGQIKLGHLKFNLCKTIELSICRYICQCLYNMSIPKLTYL
jgi:hypothetical protein